MNTYQPVKRLASHFPPPAIFLLLFFLSHAMDSLRHDTHYSQQITLHLNIYLSYSAGAQIGENIWIFLDLRSLTLNTG